MSRFFWDFVEEKYRHLGAVIERYLWDEGKCIVFNHPILGWICTKCNVESYDINAIPNRFKPIYQITDNSDVTSYTPILTRYDMGDEFSDKFCIYITDTIDGKAKSKDCIPLICDIVDIKEALRTQVFNQNTPIFAIASNEKSKQKAKNLFHSIGNNQKIMIVDSDLNNDVKVLNFNAPFNSEQLVNLIHETENEILEYLAMDNTQTFEKKERMISDEVESNNELLSSLYYNLYYSRNYASECLTKLGVECAVNQLTSSTGEVQNDTEITPDTAQNR